MRRRALACVILSLLLCSGTAALAQDSAAFDPSELERQFSFQQGNIVVGDSLATLAVPEGFRYLDGEQTSKLLELWGNPPDASTLGMLFPADVNPFDDAGWGVVITFEEDGYVKDDDAEKIDYSAMLADIQASEADENEERAEAGYEPVHLVGWAEPPRYDRSTHKLYWAKELQFGDSEDHTLNYNIRMLGRRGVLVLNAVASMDQMAPVAAGMQQVLGFVDFNPGHRYADFQAGADRVAAYGLAALVAGTVATKAGFFKLLIAGLVAAKKFVVIAVVAIAAVARRWWKNRQAAQQA